MRRGYTTGGPKGPPLAQNILRFPDYRLRLALGLFVSLIVVGTWGYHLIEHWGILDSLFMTVITLSTVGFGEVHDLSRVGMVFTVVLILFGAGAVGWALVTTFEVLASEQGLRDLERRRMMRLIRSMKNHFIICGFGRIGRSIIEGYRRNNFSFVVIESDASRIEELRTDGIPYIFGDAASDEALQTAGIAHAKALITVTPSDAVNTFIILSARWLNPNLMIVARAINPDSVAKLYRAGATKVISPHVLGGWWMAATAINPAATDFIEGLRLAESSQTSLYEFVAGGSVDGRTFGQVSFKKQTGALVVAIRRGGAFTANPPDMFVLRSGDAIIAIGSVAELERMATLVNPDAPMEVELPPESPD